MKLFNFQEEDVKHIEKWGGRVLLASEMGLGKTAISIRWTTLHPEKLPVVIICPASLKINWSRELSKWHPKAKSYIIDGSKKFPLEGLRDHYIILNYDILEK